MLMKQKRHIENLISRKIFSVMNIQGLLQQTPATPHSNQGTSLGRN